MILFKPSSPLLFFVEHLGVCLDFDTGDGEGEIVGLVLDHLQKEGGGMKSLFRVLLQLLHANHLFRQMKITTLIREPSVELLGASKIARSSVSQAAHAV